MVLSANLMGIDAEVQNKGPVRAMILRRTGFRAKIADDTTCATELFCARGNASISSPKHAYVSTAPWLKPWFDFASQPFI